MAAARLEPLLRRIGPSDLDRLTRMDAQLTCPQRSDWYERRLWPAPGEQRLSLGAEVGGELVGAIFATLREDELGPPGRVAVLEAVLLDPLYRGNGIVAELLKSLAASLRPRGIRRLQCEISWVEGRLNGFLTGRGFVPVRPSPLVSPAWFAGARDPDAGSLAF